MTTTQPTLQFDVESYSDSAYAQLMSAPLPMKTDSYTPIAHKVIIENTTETLKKMGFKLSKSIYRSAMDGMIGQGEYHLQYGNDPEMGLMIAWQNSYNKMTSFKYAVGGHVFVCSNGMVAGDIGAYRRKHTGGADQEAFGTIETYLTDARTIFEKLIQDREQLKTINLTTRQMAELMGRMYIEEQIITSTQLNIMKREYEKPSYDYGVPKENAWSLYNYATHAFKEDSPRNWLKRHVDLHEFFQKTHALESYSIPDAVEEKPYVMQTPTKPMILVPEAADVYEMF